MICVLYSSFHLVFYSLLKYKLRNVTSTLCFYWLVYILSVVLPSSVLFIMSLDILFSPLSLTFLSVYLYISGREGDVDRKSSVPTTVLSILKFPLQILSTNRPNILFLYIQPFYSILEEKSCLEIICFTVGILCFQICLDLILISHF